MVEETGLGSKPNKLPTMTWDEVKARAQRILDRYGKPPYTNETETVYFSGPRKAFPLLADDELAVLSDFVQFWLPFLVEKEKK